MGVKMGWMQIKMGHPLAQNGAALAPFRANRAHPSLFGSMSSIRFNDGMLSKYVRQVVHRACALRCSRSCSLCVVGC